MLHKFVTVLVSLASLQSRSIIRNVKKSLDAPSLPSLKKKKKLESWDQLKGEQKAARQQCVAEELELICFVPCGYCAQFMFFFEPD